MSILRMFFYSKAYNNKFLGVIHLTVDRGMGYHRQSVFFVGDSHLEKRIFHIIKKHVCTTSTRNNMANRQNKGD